MAARLGDPPSPPRATGSGGRALRATCRAALVFLALALGAGAADPPGDDDREEQPESGVFLPTDRQQERLLDRAGRLLGERRWSDGVLLLDEVLAADRDFFFRRGGSKRGTWGSIKAEAARLVTALPPPGREAYELQFRGRAERMLADAVAANDAAAILAVARRWFATPAGQRAAVLAAVEALESDQPLSAAAWLDRIAGGDPALEPTLAVMRALASDRGGDPAGAAAILDRARGAARGTARIAGRDVPVSFPPGRGLEWLRELAGHGGPVAATADWRQPRGAASRNAVTVASRPLLVPRYRVPLARHPEEARRLDKLRRELADQGAAAFPAAAPLAVEGTILARAPLGLLAIDFATGKRVWLQPGPRSAAPGGAAESGQDPLLAAFDDHTTAAASSDGRLVFVVDSHPDVVGAPGPLNAAQRQPAWQGGNTLSAYDIAASGRLAWRLPGRPGDAPAGGEIAAGSAESAAWFMGAPLVAGDRLYVMVEERAELRLDVLSAADGRVLWSQPLAELDEPHAIVGREAAARRLGGAAPALGDGVLVCPLGAGSVVAVDLANRSLLWAYEYARGPGDRGAAGNGGAVRGFPGGLRAQLVGDGPPSRQRPGWCDDGPVVAAGRVLLTPRDAEELHCLDLRDGTVAWKLPREGRLQVAGVVDDRVIVVARDGVEALALDTGGRRWRRAFDAGVSPSGRGILTADRLFLPLDSPEVVEIALADGTVAGRSPARGGAVPGNLVAYRGEVISLGVDAVDVFHQAAALESRIETAAREQPAAAWPAVWKAQLTLDAGDVRTGLARLREALADGAARQPPDTLGAALAFALARDFAAAAPLWRDCLPAEGLTPASRTALRMVVDGCLASGDAAGAWAAWRELFQRGRGVEPVPAEDPGDPRCVVTERRWLRGRLERLHGQAADPLRAEIDAALAGSLAEVASATDAAVRARGLEELAEVAGPLPAGRAVRERLVAALSAVLDGAAEHGDAVRTLAVRRDLLQLELARGLDGPQRDAAREALAAMRRGLPAGAEPSAADDDPAVAWPLGRVEVRRSTAGRNERADDTRSRLVPVAVEPSAEPLVPGLAAACDPQQARLLFLDGFGRRLGDPVAMTDGGRFGVNVLDQSMLGVAMLGRVVFVRSGAAVTALELGGRGNRRLWTTAAAGPPALVRFHHGTAALARNGGLPLGMRIVEPGDAAAPDGLWGRPVTGGLPLLAGRSLAVLDPATGAVLWERHRLPPAADLLNDDRVVCVGTADGRESPVLALADGRQLHTVQLPDRRRRLLACGSRILAIAGLDVPVEGGIADTVRLEVLDVADRSRTPLGEFSGHARACGFAPDSVAVVDPAGGLTVLDVATRQVAMQARLPGMPRSIDLVEVLPWEDRLLVCVGQRHAEGDEAAERHAVAPLQQMLLAGFSPQPLDFCVWAVDRRSGDVLWPAPATVSRHCLLAGQPAGLPVLVFARQVQRGHDRESTFLGVLCLDKRTGHAVLEDDRIPAQPHLLFGCDVIGDPRRHTITVREHGGDPRRVALEFTGEPAPPRSPHQAAGRATRTEGLIDGLNRWLESTLRPDRSR